MTVKKTLSEIAHPHTPGELSAHTNSRGAKEFIAKGDTMIFPSDGSKPTLTKGSLTEIIKDAANFLGYALTGNSNTDHTNIAKSALHDSQSDR